MKNNLSNTSGEAPETYMARKILKDILRKYCYHIEEEVELDTVTNNIGEKIWPPYRADMLLSKIFIIELDSKKLHGTKRRRSHDQWRDKNIKGQLNIPTVRLISKDIVDSYEAGKYLDILQEIHYQLGEQYNNNNVNK